MPHWSQLTVIAVVDQVRVLPLEHDVKVGPDFSPVPFPIPVPVLVPGASPESVEVAADDVRIVELVVLVQELVVVGLVGVTRFCLDKNFFLDVERVGVGGRRERLGRVQVSFGDLGSNPRRQRLHHQVVADGAVLNKKSIILYQS